jgi:hypothetical protein
MENSKEEHIPLKSQVGFSRHQTAHIGKTFFVATKANSEYVSRTIIYTGTGT